MLKKIQKARDRSRQEVLDFFEYGGPEKFIDWVGAVLFIIFWIPCCAMIWFLTSIICKVTKHGKQETKSVETDSTQGS
jgi:hypothetical protein